MSEYDLYHIDDKGRRVDLSDKQEELAEEAIERSADKMDEYVAMAEEEYMDKIYPRDFDEYLVDGAILECNQAIGEDCGYDDRGFAMQSPGKTTVLNVTGESYAKACGYLYHATVKDRKLGVNIKPFPCNCRIGANTPEEKAKVAEDELCQTEGNCRALINLNDDWDNLPSRESYFLYWNEENRQFFSGITMSSILFCKHGGIITAKTSGQRTYRVLDLMNNIIYGDIAYKSGELWTSEMIDMAKYVTLKMLLEGYSLDMIAGFVGNIVNEGNYGYFESSNYKTKKKPDYLEHMDTFHNYGTYVSGRNLYDVGTNMLVQYRKDGNCSDELHKFGLGMVQWTGGRGEALIDKYLAEFGDNAFPTREECAKVEIDYMLEELRTTYHDVIDKCEEETEEMIDTDKVAENTKIIMIDYERAGDANLSKRQEAADIWFFVLTGEDNGT